MWALPQGVACYVGASEGVAADPRGVVMEKKKVTKSKVLLEDLKGPGETCLNIYSIIIMNDIGVGIVTRKRITLPPKTFKFQSSSGINLIWYIHMYSLTFFCL